MRFALTVEVSSEIAHKTQLINNLSNNLAEHFLDKDYGNEVIRILIHVICVAPEFEWFSIVRKPRYKFYRKYKRDGVEIIEDRDFMFDLKIEYESFKNQTDEENNKMLASELIKSLSNVEKLPKRVKDFGREKFREDVENFLTRKYLSN